MLEIFIASAECRSVIDRDARLHFPATARNRDPILEVLRRLLPSDGLALEVASGSGEHTAYFAPDFPALTWQPSDRDPGVLPSIAAHAEASGASNINAPLHLDVMDWPWPIRSANAVLAINMIHIAPWIACEALIGGAGRILTTDGLLFLYGPFMRDGRHTAPSNASFDRSLRQQDPDWGVRDLDMVALRADAAGLTLESVDEMPANNLCVAFRKPA